MSSVAQPIHTSKARRTTHPKRTTVQPVMEPINVNRFKLKASAALELMKERGCTKVSRVLVCGVPTNDQFEEYFAEVGDDHAPETLHLLDTSGRQHRGYTEREVIAACLAWKRIIQGQFEVVQLTGLNPENMKQIITAKTVLGTPESHGQEMFAPSTGQIPSPVLLAIYTARRLPVDEIEVLMNAASERHMMEMKLGESL